MVVDFDVRRVGSHMPRARYQRGTLRTSVPAHAGRPERRLPRGEYWCQWFRYVLVPDGRELRRKREKIITRELAESHHIAVDYTGPLTKADAQRVLDLLIAQDSGRYIAPDTAATFEQVAREYIELNKARWGQHTMRTSAGVISVHLIGKLGQRPAASLDALELQRFLNGYVASGASKSLLNKMVLYLRAILDHAVSRRVILTNPARDPGQKLRARSHQRESSRSLSMEECQRLLSTVHGRDRLILRIFVQLGLRPEELFALRPEDVHDNAIWIREGKTDASEAPVYLPGDLSKELQAWISPETGPWLFTGPRGGMLDHQNYGNRVLRPAAKLAGVDGVNFQVLRRTCATLFGDRARDPRLTQAQLRHADPQVTLKHYQQAIPESIKSTADQLERDLGFGAPAKPRVLN